MSELDLACQNLKQALTNQAKSVDVAKKWHNMAKKGSWQTQNLRKCMSQRKS